MWLWMPGMWVALWVARVGSVRTWPAAPAYWLSVTVLTGRRGGQQSYAAKRSPVTEGPPATRGEQIPDARHRQTTQYRQRSTRHNNPPPGVWRADLEGKSGVWKELAFLIRTRVGA
jgi:hypothetical protein